MLGKNCIAASRGRPPAPSPGEPASVLRRRRRFTSSHPQVPVRTRMRKEEDGHVGVGHGLVVARRGTGGTARGRRRHDRDHPAPPSSAVSPRSVVISATELGSLIDLLLAPWKLFCREDHTTALTIKNSERTYLNLILYISFKNF